MYIEKIEKKDKSRMRIILDDSTRFLLYNGELKKLSLKEGMDVDPALFDKIWDILSKRAKMRAMNILLKSDKTAKQLRDKLLVSEYPEEIITEAVNYVSYYGYIDDERFVYNYASYRLSSKSRREIEQKLLEKGIDRTLIKKVMDDLYENEQIDESELIRTIAFKKLCITKEVFVNEGISADDKTIQKLYRHLLSKGYSYSAIRSALDITLPMP